MPINNTIVYTDPDGGVVTVSQLDDAIRTAVTDVRERMETLIDTAVAPWANTTDKVLIEGTARVFTNTLAARPTFARDGRLFIENAAPSNTDSFQYDTGAAWVDVPIGSDNLLANSVVAAKIAIDSVGRTKIPISELFQLHAALEDATDVVETAGAWAVLGTLTVAFTPASTSSIIGVFATVLTDHSNATANRAEIRIRRTTGAAATLAEGRAIRQNEIPAGQYQTVSLAAFEAAPSVAAHTYRVEIQDSAAGAGEATAKGTVIPSRFYVVEFKQE